MSDIEFNCPHCNHSLVVDASGAGLTVNCPKCSEAILIPSLVNQTSVPSCNQTALPPVLQPASLGNTRAKGPKIKISLSLAVLILLGAVYGFVALRDANRQNSSGGDNLQHEPTSPAIQSKSSESPIPIDSKNELLGLKLGSSRKELKCVVIEESTENCRWAPDQESLKLVEELKVKQTEVRIKIPGATYGDVVIKRITL